MRRITLVLFSTSLFIINWMRILIHPSDTTTFSDSKVAILTFLSRRATLPKQPSSFVWTTANSRRLLASYACHCLCNGPSNRHRQLFCRTLHCKTMDHFQSQVSRGERYLTLNKRIAGTCIWDDEQQLRMMKWIG